jgi:nicotinate-nucleotide adenylyltransferase
MRVGVFGGAFDPVHLGHLILAEHAREAARLDEVWFLPSYKPPHKTDRALSRFDQRCDLVTLATAGQPAFKLDPIEKELPPPSYTAETLAELRRRHPGASFHLLLGADSFLDLPNWYEPARVVEQAELVVVGRPGFLETIDEAAVGRVSRAIHREFALTPVSSPLIDISSRDLRRRVAEGRSIRFLVPRAVEEYIREKGLYRG